MNKIINAIKHHPYITSGIVLGATSLASATLIGGGLIAFAMVAGKFPGVHLSNLKMIIPVSIAAGVGVGSGIIIESGALGAIAIFLCRNNRREANKTSSQEMPNEKAQNDSSLVSEIREQWKDLDKILDTVIDAEDLDDESIINANNLITALNKVSNDISSGEFALLCPDGRNTKEYFFLYKDGTTFKITFVNENELSQKGLSILNQVNEHPIKVYDQDGRFLRVIMPQDAADK